MSEILNRLRRELREPFATTGRAVVAGVGLFTLAVITTEALFRHELLTDLTRIGAVLVVVLVGGRVLRVIETRQKMERTPGSGTEAARAGAAVHRLWFLMPSLVMSSQCLVFWWTTPGLIGFLALLALPASALVVVFEALRRAGALSTGRVALALGNVCSVAALIGILAALEGAEHRPAWLVVRHAARSLRRARHGLRWVRVAGSRRLDLLGSSSRTSIHLIVSSSGTHHGRARLPGVRSVRGPALEVALR